MVIATGLAGFAYVPPVLASLPPALATHTSKITSFAAFKGRDVAVIGAGQSALEAAALLREAGAQPQLLVRENSILWQIASRSNAVSGGVCARPFRGWVPGQKPGGLLIFRALCTECQRDGEPASLRTTCQPKAHGGFAIEWKIGCPSISERRSSRPARRPVAWRSTAPCKMMEVSVG